MDQPASATSGELDRFFAYSLDLLAIAGMDGYFKRVNPAFTRVLGHSEQELLAQPFLAFVHEDDRGATSAELDKLAAGAASLSFDNRYRCRDGSYRWLSWTTYPALEEGMLYAVGRDMTGSRQLAEIERRHAFLEALVENIPDMIFVKDAESLRFVRFNRAGEELLGYRREELVGRSDHDFFGKEQADFFTAKDREVLQRGELVEVMEEPIETRHKGLRLLHTKKIPIFDAQGKPLYLLGISEDITEQKRAREVLQAELQRELPGRDADLETLAREVTLRKREAQSASEAMRVARDYAERASEFKTSFLRMMSHELRTPLTTLQLHVQRLGRDPTLTPAQREAMEWVARPTRRLVALVESVLDYSRIESGLLLLKIEPFDVGEVAARLVSELAPLAEQKGLDLQLGPLPPDLPPLVSDTALVRLILMNLVENAIKHTARGRIEVIVDHEPGAHTLTVNDSGRGIPPELQQRVFEPFVQACEDTNHKHTAGVGLGLALVRELVTALGGEVALTSTVDVGSSFSVRIPPASPAAPAAGGQP